jgi:hypothetical protein
MLIAMLTQHWTIDTFTSPEDVTRWVDPWRERAREEPGEGGENRILVDAEEAGSTLSSTVDGSQCGFRRSTIRKS